MKKTALLAVVVIGVLALLALTSRSLRDDTPEQILLAFRADAGVTFGECANEDCIDDAALGACTPMHFKTTFHTIEGTPVINDYFVVGSAGECEVVVFADYTKDPWGGCRVYRQVCPTVRSYKRDTRDGCTHPVILFAVPGCD
ncbi:MAG: hypothetical protein JNM17_12025 [Archangium sp.]|nr:hypothetical protein [Archangium sp.]